MYHLIISDLHLNPFKIDIAQLNWLNSLYSNPKISQITFNGDTWEGFGLRTPGKPRFDIFYHTWYLPFLKELTTQKPTEFIPGNHDSWVWWDPKKIPFKRQVTYTYGKSTFFITHGHQYALRQSDGSISNLALDMIIVTLYKLFPELINGTFGRFFNWQAKNRRQQHKDLESKNLVIGHTHFFELDPKEKFFNSGANIFGTHHGLIDTKTGKVLPLSSIL